MHLKSFLETVWKLQNETGNQIFVGNLSEQEQVPKRAPIFIAVNLSYIIHFT